MSRDASRWDSELLRRSLEDGFPIDGVLPQHCSPSSGVYTGTISDPIPKSTFTDNGLQQVSYNTSKDVAAFLSNVSKDQVSNGIACLPSHSEFTYGVVSRRLAVPKGDSYRVVGDFSVSVISSACKPVKNLLCQGLDAFFPLACEVVRRLWYPGRSLAVSKEDSPGA